MTSFYVFRKPIQKVALLRQTGEDGGGGGEGDTGAAGAVMQVNNAVHPPRSHRKPVRLCGD